MKETPEQLRELIRRFYDLEHAEEIAAEIEQAEARIASFPSPRQRRKRHFSVPAAVGGTKPIYLWRLAAVAACLAAACTLFIYRHSMSLIGPIPRHSSTLMISWEQTPDENGFVQQAASELDDISAQIEDLQASHWDTSPAWQEDISDLENSDWITNTNFWKG